VKHLDPERLGASPLSEDEQTHLASCLPCRASRRLALSPRQSAHRIGPYEVLGLLGAGGMARVYAGLHPELGEERAVKVLAVQDAIARERLVREAQLQRRVSHPHVLPLLDVLHTDDGLALVLPRVRGPNLARLLA
jgi:serine/threonine protein kinase